MVPLSILLGTGLTVLTSVALGRVILRRLKLELYRGEEDALAFITGAAVLSGVIFALCALGIAQKASFLTIFALVLGAAWFTGAHRDIRPAFPALPKRWAGLFWAGFAVFTVLYFLSAMAPEFSPDGTAYHLSFVARYAREGGFVRIPWNIYAQLS